MDIEDLKNKTEKELRDLLHEEQHRLHELRLKVGEKQLKNVRAIRKNTKLIARILTLLNNRQNAAK